MAISAVLVFPRIIAPAAFRRATAGASRSGTNAARIAEPLVVLRPAVSIVSLIVIGTPCSAPRFSPRTTAASASLALSIRSGARVTIAFIAGLSFSIRWRQASATSTGEALRVRISSASLVSDSVIKSALSCVTLNGTLFFVSLLFAKFSI